MLLSLTGGLFQISLVALLNAHHHDPQSGQSPHVTDKRQVEDSLLYEGCHTLKFIHEQYHLAKISLALLLIENTLYILSAYWIFFSNVGTIQTRIG